MVQKNPIPNHRLDGANFPLNNLGGGFTDFLFSPLPTNIFEKGLKPPTSNGR